MCTAHSREGHSPGGGITNTALPPKPNPTTEGAADGHDID